MYHEILSCNAENKSPEVFPHAPMIYNGPGTSGTIQSSRPDRTGPDSGPDRIPDSGFRIHFQFIFSVKYII